MKKLLLLAVLTLAIMSCEKNDTNEPTVYDIEGKWLFPSDTPGISDQGISNTMYIFENGIRYTFYCVGDDCESQYETFEVGDPNAIPGTNEYTFEDGILTIDLNFGNFMVSPIIFECDGGRINFQDPEFPDRSDFVRLGADVNNCN
ncbi:MAG: hypothetical protein ACI97N_002723 [Cognaticolwellia sp.]|jgi:hypothetical protein